MIVHLYSHQNDFDFYVRWGCLCASEPYWPRDMFLHMYWEWYFSSRQVFFDRNSYLFLFLPLLYIAQDLRVLHLAFGFIKQ